MYYGYITMGSTHYEEPFKSNNFRNLRHYLCDTLREGAFDNDIGAWAIYSDPEADEPLASGVMYKHSGKCLFTALKK